jgi:hypothetical protein
MLLSRFARPNVISRAFYTTQIPAGLSEGERHIFQKLSEALSPSKLRVADVSGKNSQAMSL